MTDVGDSFAPLPDATRPKVPAWVVAGGVAAGVLALGLGVRAEFENRHQNALREQDRIDADVEGCERTNEGRIIDRTVAESLRVYVDGVLDGVADYAQLSEAERAVLAENLRDDEEAITDAIETIETTDCAAVVPGAEP